MKNIFKHILFSIITLAVGYGAMALPFHLLSELSRSEMRILFAAEIIIYFTIFSAVMLAKERKHKIKANNNTHAKKRKQDFFDMQNEIAEIGEEVICVTKAA